MGTCKSILLLTLLITSHYFLLVQSIEFQVGGDKGWVIPPSKNAQLYNDWASKNRFNINDTLHFKYEKDSVLEVTEAEYNKCLSSHPILFSNNGDTVYKLERSGLFYFISGVSGHCERGLRMIIKVLEPETPPESHNDTKKSGANEMGEHIHSPTNMVFMVISFVGAFLF